MSHTGRVSVRLAFLLGIAHFAVPQLMNAAEPKLTRFYPPAVGAGQSWTVTAEGTFAEWPVEVHVFPPDLQVMCLEKKGQVELTAGTECPSGRYWVRFSNDEGWSDPQPIIVSSSEVQLETSGTELSNGDRVQPDAPQKLPAMFAGKLEKSGDVDTYIVPVKANQTLTVSVTSNEIFSSPADCVLQVVSSKGFVLAQNDDERNLDPLVRWTSPTDGEVAVRLFCFPVAPNSTIAFAGGGAYIYLLEATQGAYLDYTLPLASNAESRAATAIGWHLPDTNVVLRPITSPLGEVTFAGDRSAGWFQPERTDRQTTVLDETEDGPILELPIDASGHLEQDGDVDRCQFEARKGATYSIEVQCRRFRLATDATLKILSADGKTLATADDIARDKRDVQLKWKSPSDQTVRLEVRDLHDRGGDRFGYRILVSEEKPALRMTTPKDWVVTDQEKGGALEITLAWENGLKTDLKLQAIDQQGKVIAEQTVAAAAKKVAFKVSHQGGQWRPITIQAKIGDEPPTMLRFEKSGLSSRVVWVR